MVKSTLVKNIRIFLALFLSFLLPVLACNFPGIAIQPPIQGGVDLRLTLQAMATPVAQTPLPPAAQSPAPGEPMPPGTEAVPSPAISLSTPTAIPVGGDGETAYTSQSGDTLEAVALRFGVEPGQIRSAVELPVTGFLPVGAVLFIPWEGPPTLPYDAILPDTEVLYSLGSIGFDPQAFIQSAGGYLSSYTEEIDKQTLTGAEIVEKVAYQASVNPMLLLGILEHRSGWVRGEPFSQDKIQHPIGFYVPGRSGLYEELRMTATQINLGYYGWRQGTQVTTKFANGQVEQMHPALNAGSTAVENLYSKFYPVDQLQAALLGPEGLVPLYSQMFGDAWARAASTGPIFTGPTDQPTLELPFLPGERWSLTAGPHQAWDYGTPRAALDFSPTTGGAPCAVSTGWTTASAPGVIARSGDNTVVLDVDGDGMEQTGWVLVYFHVADEGRIHTGTQVAQDTPLGHPSCEGGTATGKHTHFSRKYNGEWLAADGPVPFVLSGWRAVADSRNYHGTLVKDGQSVTSDPGGPRTSIIVRQ